MRRYEAALAKLHYSNAIALKNHPDHDWMEASLIKEPLWRTSGVNGEDYYCGEIIFYGCTWLDDDTKVYAFHHPENKRRILEAFPELVVEADPAGPDLCPKCGGQEAVILLSRDRKIPVTLNVVLHKAAAIRTIIDTLLAIALGIAIGWYAFA